jgi:ABC-type uncharacterized transport system substrate-binding protein
MRNAYVALLGDEAAAGEVIDQRPVDGRTFELMCELIIALAARLNLPAIYPFRYFPKSGGLVSYGIDQIEQARGGASYIDRILRGANPSELPVQLPTKYELVVNLKTAKTLDLDVPLSLQQRADEVIE